MITGLVNTCRLKAGNTLKPSLAMTTGPYVPPVPTFRATWNTEEPGSSNSQQIRLPLSYYGSYNFEIDWGDGNIDTITAWNQAEKTHTYNSPGIYETKITGTINGWNFPYAGSEAPKLYNVSEWGPLKLRDTPADCFKNCSNFTCNATDTLDATNLGTLVQTFRNCSSLVDIKVDITGATSLVEVFLNCTSFNGDLSTWNTSNVTTMAKAFQSCSSFNGNITTWDTSNVTTTYNMFKSASSFNQNISSWNMSNVTNIARMFQYASSFNQPIGTWNINKITSLYEVFNGASAFNQDLTSWNTYKVSNMYATFAGCSSFNGDITSWNTSNVNTLRRAFLSASSFNQNISSWNTYKVTNLEATFRNADAFSQPIGSWNTSNTINMHGTFGYNDVFDEDLSGWDFSSVTDIQYMFIYSTLSTTNYDKLLVELDAQTVTSNLNFSGGYSKYTPNSAASTARANLISSDGWTISDGGPA